MPKKSQVGRSVIGNLSEGRATDEVAGILTLGKAGIHGMEDFRDLRCGEVAGACPQDAVGFVPQFIQRPSFKGAAPHHQLPQSQSR